MSNDLTARLEAATKKRTALEAQIQRIQGKLEATQAALAAVEDECRRKGVDPSKLDETIEALTKKFSQEVEAFEQRLAQAEQALTPYTGEAQ